MAEKSAKTKPKRSMWKNTVFFVKNMWRYEKSMPILFFVMTVTDAVFPYFGILLPKFMLDILQDRLPFPTWGKIENIFIVLGLFAVLSVFFVTLAQFTSSKYWPMLSKFRYHMQNKIIDKIMTMDYPHTEDPQMHDRIKKANETVAGGVFGLLGTLGWMSSNVLTLIGYAALILTLNPFIFLYLIFNTLANFFTLRNARKFEYVNRDAISNINRQLGYIMQKMSDFACGKETRIYGLQKWLGGRHYETANKANKWYIRIRLRYYFVNLVEGVVTLLRDAISYGYLIYRCLDRTNPMTIANFTMYYTTISNFTKLMLTVPHAYSNIAQSAMYVDDMQDLLEMKDKIDLQALTPLPEGVELPCAVEFENVSYRYPNSDKYILKNFSLKINSGGRLAIVGANGAGKTTFVKLLCGLYEPEDGRILINGCPLTEYNRKEYYSLYSVVFQDVKLLAFSLAENIALCPIESVDRERVLSSLEKAGLGEKIGSLPLGIDTSILKALDEHGIEPSGGESQKIALARALYKNSPVVVLDEPTAALDPLAEYNVYKQFDSLAADKTAIYISHRLSSTRFCDTVAFFEDGVVAEFGSHTELMARNGHYAKMFNIQAYYYTAESENAEVTV